jgi:hypothetical protein
LALPFLKVEVEQKILKQKPKNYTIYICLQAFIKIFINFPPEAFAPLFQKVEGIMLYFFMMTAGTNSS